MHGPTDLEARLIGADVTDFCAAALDLLRQRFPRLQGAGLSMFVALPLEGPPVAYGGNVPLQLALVHVAICAGQAMGDGSEHGTRELPKVAK